MMGRSDERVCCQEIPEMLSLNEEVIIIKKIKDPLTCVTDNPAFAAVYLGVCAPKSIVSIQAGVREPI